jgi:amino acid adenylation domain-containing protein
MTKPSNPGTGHLLEDPIQAQEQHPEHAGGHALAESETYAMPATQGQLRFWSLDQLNPGNPALNMPLMWQCTGVLNIPAMVEAFAQCTQRHEMLRTTFELVDGELSQIIHPHMEIPIPVLDLTSLSGEAQRVEADRLTRDHAAFRFKLSVGPLLVLKLLKLSPQHHLLLVTMHHIICDGISNGVLMRDMVRWYEAILKGSTPDLPELPIQFADYAIWHQQWRAGEEPAASMEFWRKALGNGFTPIHLRHDPDAASSLTPERANLTGDIETLLIPPDLTARAHAFCIRENVTLNMLLFSIFCALLSRLTGQKDLTIGSPCANRTEDTDELIGLFMNIQVLRVRLQDDSTFRDLLRQVQTWTLGAYENQVLPFEDLIYDPYFSESGSSFEIPIFFLYQKSFMLTGRIHSQNGDLEIVPLRSESPGAVFEVMFAIVDREEEGPRLQLEYNPQYFKNTTIQRYLRLFLNLLESALNTPGQLVDRLSLLSTTERSRLLTEHNRTAVDFGPFEAVHETFLRRAESQPEAVAAICENISWTNAELTHRARTLAGQMHDAGLKPGELVAICVPRSLDMLAAVLAVMIAGGVYVPLDPRHPRARLETILTGSGAQYLLYSGTLNLTTDAKLVSTTSPAISPIRSVSLTATLPDSLAYVIYTSGSTGKPKGVAIEHAALTNLLRSMQQQPGLSATDTLVAITTLTFDIAALELLLPLLTGAKVVIATQSQVKNPTQLLALLQQSKATVMQATPGAWRALVDAGWTNSLPLRALCGGDALSRDLAELLLDRASEVWNLYGPTETTIWSSVTRVTHGTGAPRLGTPLANTQFYVLDKFHEPTSIAIDGELYIGGAGLARGYWNQPEMTAKRFLANPFGAGRLYCTGDLARRHEDGTIELLGRADFQVKVRGYRIELGEIESALRKHPSVHEAVVVQRITRGTHSSDSATRLIAYVDAGAHAEPQHAPALINELTMQLAASLPDYMQPSVIVALAEMPLNTNGKIDRKALPDVLDHAGDSGIRNTTIEVENFLEPRDVIEQQITELWQNTLGIPRISLRANFFSLGVGSLAALRLITKMNRTYAMDLGLASLISASNIESIAELVRNRFAPNTASSLGPIQPVGSRTPLFIVHGVGGNVVNFYGLSQRMGADQPVYGIQSQALVSGAPALIRLKDMASLYLADVRKVQPHGPYKFLGYSFGGTVVLEMAHQLRATGEEVSLIGMLDAKTKHYDEELTRSRGLQGQAAHRVNRFTGNIKSLTLKGLTAYIWDKLKTRAVRYSCAAAAKLNMTRVPAFMKSAYDINHVAIQNYELRPIDAHLILFRAEEQDHAAGSYELGWKDIFRGGIEVHDLTGDHERIFLEPNIEVLASSLRACLQKS